MGGTSRVTGDSQARFCEGLGVKFPGPTRPGTWRALGKKRSAMVPTGLSFCTEVHRLQVNGIPASQDA
jgi:hypothetical protein